MNTRHRAVSRSRASANSCETLESRRLLTADNINLSDLVARSANPSAPPTVIFDSVGNRYRLYSRSATPDQPSTTYLRKSTAAGQLLWDRKVGERALISDSAFGPDGSLYLAGINDTVADNLPALWRFTDGASWRQPLWDYYHTGWWISDITIDPHGNAIFVGSATRKLSSLGRETASIDVAVASVSASGQLLWTRFLDGSADDKGNALALSRSGEIVIGGITDSLDLEGAISNTPSHSFVALLDGSGTLVGSAYVHGDLQPVHDLLAASTYGTSMADDIRVTPAQVVVGGSAQPGVKVTVNGVAGAPFVPSRPLVILGGLGDDRIEVSAELTLPIRIHGGEGNDTIYGGAGADTLYGGNGRDVVVGRAGNDLMEGDDSGLNWPLYPPEDYHDLLEGGEGNDTLKGGVGSDTLYGHDGADLLNGEAGDDELYGNPGDDTLQGSDGRDYVNGNDGYDVDVRPDEGDRGTAERYLFFGGEYTCTAGQMRIICDGQADIHIEMVTEGYLIHINYSVLTETQSVRNIYIQTGPSSDTIFIRASVPTIVYAGNGQDTISTGDGDDIIHGNLGHDRIWSGGGNDQIFGGLGGDLVAGEEGDDQLFGGDGEDWIAGGPGADHIEGKGKADTIYGGNGNDTILSGAGPDLIFGEDGDDDISANAHPLFRDTVRGGSGYDRYEADDDDLLIDVEQLLT